jgi:hypothetical protein
MRQIIKHKLIINNNNKKNKRSTHSGREAHGRFVRKKLMGMGGDRSREATGVSNQKKRVKTLE